MTPIDDELRIALHERASTVSPTTDAFVGIERRAKGIRRRRLAGAVAGSALALAAVAVAVPTISGALDGDGGSTGRFAVQPTVAPSAAGSPSPASSTSPQGATLQNWPYVGMNTVADGANRIDMVQKMSQALAARWPGAQVTLQTLHPLYGGISSSDQLVLVAAGKVTGNPQAPKVVAAAWVKPTNGSAALVGLHDISADAAQVSVFVPAPGTPRDGTAVVVSQPGTGQVMLQKPGGTWQPVNTVEGRYATFGLTMPPAGQVVPQIMVLDGDGNMDHPLYQGPIGRGLTFPDI